MVIHPGSGRLVTLGERPIKPGGRLAAPEVTWDWDNPATWPAEAASSGAYQPADWLALMVMIRDQTCRWPGCDKPATGCQIDHHRPFNNLVAPETQTLASNLGCLCTPHHQVKHLDEWTVRRDPNTGITTWTHLNGLVYQAPPHNLTKGGTMI